jgi:hypothetical protein
MERKFADRLAEHARGDRRPERDVERVRSRPDHQQRARAGRPLAAADQRVLDAQRALFAQQDAYIVNRSNVVGSLVALYKALGGGWDTGTPLVDPATRAQMQRRTDWGDLLDEPRTTPAAVLPPEGASR